jgi:hypothetical protein
MISRRSLIALVTAEVVTLSVAVASALPSVPAGLQLGDHYQLIFVTSGTLGIASTPGGEPQTFSGLESADRAVTYFAWQANWLPN